MGRAVDCIFDSKLLFFVFNVSVLASLMEPLYFGYATTVAVSVSSLIQNFAAATHWFWRVWKFATILLVFGCFAFRRTGINALLWWAGAFEVFSFLATLLNGGDPLGHLKYHVFPVIALVYMQVALERDAASVLKALMLVLGTLIHVNALCWLLYPEGMYSNWIGYKACWFLGYDNLAVPFILLADLVGFYRMVKAGRPLWWDVSVILSGLAFSFGRVLATGILAGAGFFGGILLLWNKRLRSLLGRPKLLVLAMFGLFFFLQFVDISQGGLLGHIFALLGKNSTFTNRLWVWDRGWTELLQKGLFLGRGYLTGPEYSAHFGWIVMSQLHSTYLQAVYESGLVSLLLLLGMVLTGVSNYKNFSGSYGAAVVLAGFMSFMLVWQMEHYLTLSVCSLMALSMLYNIGCLEAVPKPRSPRVRIVWRRGGTVHFRLCWRKRYLQKNSQAALSKEDPFLAFT